MTCWDVYVERFWSYVDRRGPDDCWPYTRWCCNTKLPYGQFYIGKRIQAHRFAYEIENGEGSAEGWKICHTCDNPRCCNPAHLFRGTPNDNMQDKIAKGRARYIRGEECPWSKLSDKDVLEIKKQIEAGVVQRRIAEAYSVDPALITYIKQGKTRKHVSEI